MSYYRLFQVDIVQTSQLYLGGGINQPLPTVGNSLVADGSGGTLFSTLASGVNLFQVQSTINAVGIPSYVLSSYVSTVLLSTQQSLSTFAGYGFGLDTTPYFITNDLLTSSIGGLGTSGYVSTHTMAGYVVNTVTQLGASGYISSSQLVSSVTGLNSIIYTQVLTENLTSTVNNLGNSYISSPALISTVNGLGQIYISTPALLSVITNLGQTYVSATDVVLARYVAVGLSTSFLTAQTGVAGTFYGSNTFTNTLAAGSIALSTSLTLTDAPLTMTYNNTVPTPAVLMNSATGNPINFQMLAGTTNSLTLNVNGTSNASILSQNPGSQITNPLTFGASYIQAITSSFTVTNTAGLTNDNTQILTSTISTGIVQANFFMGDGSQLINLPILTITTVNSSILGIAPSLSTFSTQLTSTLINYGPSYTSLNSTLTGFVPTYSTVLGQLDDYISTYSGTLTAAGDVVLARYVTVGLSTSFLTAQTAVAGTFYGSNSFTNTLAAGSIALSTSLTLTDAPLTMTYNNTVPTPAVLMNSATGNPINFQMLAGTTNSLVLSVDGTSNASILSQNPGSQITNPLTFGASYIQAITSSFTVTNTAGLTNDNTQILTSTISTGIVKANFFMGDGSQLINLPLPSLTEVNSSISGYAPTFSTLSTQITSTLINYGHSFTSLDSTLIGFGPSYSTLYAHFQTYTSSYAGAIMSTGLLTAAQVLTNSVNISSTTGAYWIATGAAATTQATVEYSLDGLNWTNATAGGFSVQGNDVAFNGSLWVATGQDATPANNIQYSYNGQSWIQASGANFSVQGYGITWNGTIWVAVGQDATPANTIKYSSNGINWFNSSGTGFSIQGNAVSWNGRIWIAVGQDATTVNAVQYSYDGINWTPANGTSYSATQYAVAWNGTFWLIGGLASGASAISYSRDGINWSPIISPFQYSVNRIKWNGIYWVAVGQDTGVSVTRYSYDGLKWLNSVGIQFSAYGSAVDWNGSYWIASGQDSSQTALIKKSTDGINWINSATNNFTTIVTDIAYSSNTTPSYQQSNFYIAPQSIPLPFLSTNQFFFTPDAMNVNNTLWINNKTNLMGVNCNAPSYTLDIYGNMNVSSVIYASSFIGDGSLLSNTVLPDALFSTVVGLGTLGYISTAIDYSSFAISSVLFYNNDIITSTVTGLQNSLLFTSTVYASTSFSTLNVIALNAISIQTSTITASTMNAIRMTASTGNFSSINASTYTFTDGSAKRMLLSSLYFYSGDGYIVMPDVQHSNVSTITLYTSSLQANGLRTSNILIGSNWQQTPIQFYGRSGDFNNTAIVEQSTAQTSQELLLFRGSSTTDQVRVQTTGQFRLETGVSARLFPTTTQLTTATMLVDINSNVAVNGTQFYIAGAPNYNTIGVNTVTPLFNFDVNGTVRTLSAVISTAQISSAAFNTILTPLASISTLTVSSIPYVYASSVQTNALLGNFIFTSSVGATSAIFSSVTISSMLTVSSAIINFALISTISVNTISAGIVYIGNLYASSLYISTNYTSKVVSQALLTSSLGFYTGDGYLTIPDVQHSNVSTITLYTSSLQANGVRTSNILIGSNWQQTPIQFYGRSGDFNNTAIVEQSTAQTSQELLFFRGSSITDQVRVQTTGQFRLETGVSARLFPTTTQLTTATMLVDTNSNFTINGTQLYIAGAPNYNTIGVNTITPLFNFDVNGTVRTLSAVISTAQISSAAFNTIFTPLGSISTLTVSSIPYVYASSVQTNALLGNFIFTSSIGATSAIFSSVTISSMLTVSSAIINFALISTISVNTISAGTVYIGNLYTSSLYISANYTAKVVSQTLITSSLGFYTGDGYILMPDLQNSNVSTVTLYTSSLQANGVRTSNILIGSNWQQTPIQFFGRSGDFNNTAIVEQSTAQTSQELLLFRGSSTTDQVRVQTTGQFRLETGVSARLFPTTGQIATATMLVDTNSNVTINGTQFYIQGAPNYNTIGVNTVTPLFNFDVNGTIRTLSAVISTAQISSAAFNTVFTPLASISTLTVSSIPYVYASSVQTNALLANFIFASSVGATSAIFSSVTISSMLTVSSAMINFAIISTISANSISSGIGYFGNLYGSSFYTSTTFTAKVASQIVLTSSLGFYAGDGYIVMPDVQHSNISTNTLYTSSLQANGVRTSNILIGSNWLQTPIQFYGRSGDFNNTAIVEQSTAQTSQELLFFRGSSTTDQVRVQTTGQFRLETGVSARLFPTTTQLATATMLVDTNSNVAINGSQLYIAGAPNYNTIGVNTATPLFNLDVNGTVRALSAVISSVQISNAAFNTIFTSLGSISALTVSTMTAFNTNTLTTTSFFTNSMNASNVNANNVAAISGIFSNVTLSTTNINFAFISTLSVNTLSAGTAYIGNLVISSLNANTLSTVNTTSRQLLTSSIAFYTGDGYITMPYVQHSNVSTTTLFTSSLQANGVRTSNIQFYGLSSNFNNTAILEQNTSLISQELLLFRGSSTADQVRIQTTGVFRLETGASARLFPTTAQLATPVILADTNSNVAINGTQLYIAGSPSYNTIGINTATPLYNLDVNGTLRAINTLFSTQTLYSSSNVFASISSLTVSSVAFNVNFSTIQVNTVNASSIYTPYISGQSSLFSTVNINRSLIASNGTFQTITANIGSFSSLTASEFGFTRLNISTASFSFATTQSLQTSSLNFYTGDGFVRIPDLQSSNVSSMALYTSSVLANTGLFATNLAINSNTPRYNLDVNGIANLSSITRVNIAPGSNIQRWVAGGTPTTGTLAYSDDGINWIGLGSSIFSTQGYGFAWNGIRWVAVGQGTNGLAYSSDGINWIGLGTSIFSFGYGVAWNGALWVSVGIGTNTIAYSSDGISWTGISPASISLGFCIAWNGILWVAGTSGTNAISYSPDGINWTAAANAAFSTRTWGIAWNGIRWVAVGQGTNSIAYSSDGINWIGIPSSVTTFSTNGYCVAWNGKLFVSGGSGTNSILYSRDGINWTVSSSGNSVFGSYCQGIAWNGTLFIGGGQANNKIAYSVDGINWVGSSSGNAIFAICKAIGYSSNVVPSYTQATLDILPSQNNGIPLFLRSTNQIFLAASSMTINGTLSVDSLYNRVGINNPMPLFNFDVNGNARISSLTIGDVGTGVFTSTNTTFQLAVYGTNGPARVGGTTWTQISDERIKRNISNADLDQCYEDVKAITLRRFTYASTLFEAVPLSDRNVLGFIAQEVKQVYPKAVVESAGFGISDLNWLNIDQMNMSLYGAVKKVITLNESLTSTVFVLQQKISTLEGFGGNV